MHVVIKLTVTGGIRSSGMLRSVDRLVTSVSEQPVGLIFKDVCPIFERLAVPDP
jgi:hypothetical protein